MTEAEQPQPVVDAPALSIKPELAGSTVHVLGEEEGLTTYPAGLASHDAVCEDLQLFTSLLQDLNAKLQTAQPKKYRPSKYRVPTVAGRELNLHMLYRLVTSMGGGIAVTAENKWLEVIAPFNFTAKVNLSAIRRIYSSLLWHFEQVYQHKAAGQKLQEPPELPAGAVDPALADGLPTRPSRNRRGTSLAAIIAATDNMDSDMEDEAAPAAAGGKQGAAAAPAGADGQPKGAAGDAAAGGAKAGPDGAAAGRPGDSKAAAGRDTAAKPQRSRPQQQRAPVAAPAATPELVGFLKSGKTRRDLTGQAVAGRVDAKFDCGYFVSLNIAGQSFSGILYCPTAVAAAAAAGASAQAAAAGRAAAVKREDGAAGDAGRKAGNGSSSVKREAGAAGVDGGDAAARGNKRRRSQVAVDGTVKPKSAKTAFNFFAAEQWPVVKAELGPNAVPQEISRAVGEKWNRTTDAERTPYVNKSLEDKTRYERELAGWRQGLESPGSTAAAEASTPTGAGVEGAAGVGTPGGGLGKPPSGRGAAAGRTEGAEPMDVDGDGATGEVAAGQQEQQQHKHKLKFKLASHGSVAAAAAVAAAASAAAKGGVNGAAAGDGQAAAEPATAAAPAAAADEAAAGQQEQPAAVPPVAAAPAAVARDAAAAVPVPAAVQPVAEVAAAAAPALPAAGQE